MRNKSVKLLGGYVEKCDDGNYYITPAQKDEKSKHKYWYCISEEDLSTMVPLPSEVKLMYKPDLWARFKKLSPEEINDGYYNEETYSPYYTKVLYVLDSKKKKLEKIQSASDMNNTEGIEEGYILSSGFMPAGEGNGGKKAKLGKKMHYIIRAVDNNEPKKIIDWVLVDMYNTDLVRKKYKGNADLDQRYKFYHLPVEKNKPKLIFYVEIDGEIIYFGFTPHLRVFYDYSVHQGIPQHFRKGNRIDYCKSLFGFNENQTTPNNLMDSQSPLAYKSRVSFGDMQALGVPQVMDTIALVLSEPKSTAYPLYLKQSNEKRWVTYNSPNFRIRGVKRYWIKNEECPNYDDDQNRKITTSLKPLAKSTCFKGQIRFSNLSEDELGLLLWAIMLEPESRVQIGKGKPYGYGRMRLKRDKMVLKIENLSKKYGNSVALANDYMEVLSLNDITRAYVQAYFDYMRNNFDIDIENEPHIKSFFTMTSKVMENSQVRYMRIGNGDSNEYKSLDPLKSVEDIALEIEK